MGFDTPAGTRGARQPSGPFFRWLNKVMARRLRRKGGKMMGFNARRERGGASASLAAW
jgi:hypothetical protein